MEMWEEHVTDRRKSVAKAQKHGHGRFREEWEAIHYKCLKKINNVALLALLCLCLPPLCLEHRTQTSPNEVSECRWPDI